MLHKDMKDYVDHFLNVNPQEVKMTMEEAKRRRDINLHKTGSTKDLAMRSLGTVPIDIIRGMERQFGKDIWKDPKFRREFFDTYKLFKTCEKI